jgi:GNAT superfamily N-acetyltransferase
MTGMTEIRSYLQMNDVAELRPAAKLREDVEIRQQERPDPAMNRRLYCLVGEPWQWVDRLVWTDDEWLAYVRRPEIETWVLWSGDEPAGYFELEDEPDGSVKVAYFGLAPSFIGRGLGGYLLTVAVERAWAKGANRVWVHTCTHDHPYALANYEARGFRVYRIEGR